MAHRHKVQARASGGRAVFSKKVAHEAASKKETFDTGGVVAKRAHGGGVRGRADRRARGGSVWSSASFGGSKGHAGPPNAGKATKHAAGGAVKARRHGGKCEDDDDDEDGEDEDDERARGGRMHAQGFPEKEPQGMHYRGGKGRHKRAKGGRIGHIDVFVGQNPKTHPVPED